MEVRTSKSDELRRCRQRIAILEAQLHEVAISGWSSSRMIKLRRFETLYTQLAAVLRAEHLSPIDALARVRALWTTDLKQYVPSSPLPVEELPIAGKVGG